MRLRELDSAGGKMIDRKEHKGAMEDKLRKRTQARALAALGGPGMRQCRGHRSCDISRRRVGARSRRRNCSYNCSYNRNRNHRRRSRPYGPRRPTRWASHAPRPSRRTRAGTACPGTAGRERLGTGGGPGTGTGTPGASPKNVGNAPLPNAAKANANATAIVYPSQPSKGPATFQEMGYHSQKPDKNECIIM